MGEAVQIKEIIYVMVPTDINCPNCGNKVLRREWLIPVDDSMQNELECECGWTGNAYNENL